MTPSDLEDAIARLKGQNQAHAMLLTNAEIICQGLGR